MQHHKLHKFCIDLKSCYTTRDDGKYTRYINIFVPFGKLYGFLLAPSIFYVDVPV